MTRAEHAFVRDHGRRPALELAVYFGLTFLITGGLGAAYLVAPSLGALSGVAEGGRFESSWLYAVAVCAPSISALVCLGLLEGRGAYIRLFKNLLAPGRLD